MDFITENWTWISSNPKGFVLFAAVFFGFGWGAARILYHERLELLKEHAVRGKTKSAATTPSTFAYEPQGRHGRNLLASSTHDARVGEQLSLQATIPENSRLHITMKGPPPTLGETMAAWSMNVMGVVNWTPSRYQESTQGCTQHFNAEGGRADLQFSFHRSGEVVIEAFEDDSKTASWSKRIHVA